MIYAIIISCWNDPRKGDSAGLHTFMVTYKNGWFESYNGYTTKKYCTLSKLLDGRTLIIGYWFNNNSRFV